MFINSPSLCSVGYPFGHLRIMTSQLRICRQKLILPRPWSTIRSSKS